MSINMGELMHAFQSIVGRPATRTLGRGTRTPAFPNPLGNVLNPQGALKGIASRPMTQPYQSIGKPSASLPIGPGGNILKSGVKRRTPLGAATSPWLNVYGDEDPDFNL